MNLYHGSNIEVKEPKLLPDARALDFGAGFYLTSSIEQAERWAKSVTKRRKTREAVVSIYHFDEELVKKQLNVKHFESANREWLHFVSKNRKSVYVGEKYDIVIGPVANDNTMTIISDYMTGTLDEETALILLLPQKLKDQCAFLTLQSLTTLKFIGVKNYD